MYCYHLVNGMQMCTDHLFSSIFLDINIFSYILCMYVYKTIVNITTNLLYIGYLGVCAFHKCNLGQWGTTEGATSTQVTVMWSSKANANPKSQIQIFETLGMNRIWLLWLSPMTVVHDMCGPICLEKHNHFSFSAGKNSFLTGSQAIQANLWHWNHVRCAWLCYSILFFFLIYLPKAISYLILRVALELQLRVESIFQYA